MGISIFEIYVLTNNLPFCNKKTPPDIKYIKRCLIMIIF